MKSDGWVPCLIESIKLMVGVNLSSTFTVLRSPLSRWIFSHNLGWYRGELFGFWTQSESISSTSKSSSTGDIKVKSRMIAVESIRDMGLLHCRPLGFLRPCEESAQFKIEILSPSHSFSSEAPLAYTHEPLICIMLDLAGNRLLIWPMLAPAFIV